MVITATATDVGTRKHVNEDACCIEVAKTALGDITLAIVCDGVGGYSKGELASTTVVHAFSSWFENDLPLLLANMSDEGELNCPAIQAIWEAMLHDLNATIRSYGVSSKAQLGSTFTGMLACGGKYLIGHVGDCRVICISPDGARQLTEDQTLLAKLEAEGKAVSEEERAKSSHVILQSVGTQRVLKPAFVTGTYASDSVFVICCDGAWKRPGNDGVAYAFKGSDRDDATMRQACQGLVESCKELGEADNITVVAFADRFEGRSDRLGSPSKANMDGFEATKADDATTVVFANGGNDSPTVTYGEGGA